jgi:hypothetical protein
MGVFSRIVTARTVTLVVFETMLIVAAIEAAVFLRFGGRTSEFMIAGDWLLKLLLVAGVLQACL